MSLESRATPIGRAPRSRDLWASGAAGQHGCEPSRTKRVLHLATAAAVVARVVSCTRGHTSRANAPSHSAQRPLTNEHTPTSVAPTRSTVTVADPVGSGWVVDLGRE